MAIQLTQEERAAIKSQKDLADAGTTAATQSADGIGRAMVSQKKSDNAIRKVLDYFDSILHDYDTEIQFLSGAVITDPVYTNLQPTYSGTGNGVLSFALQSESFPEAFTLTATDSLHFSITGTLSGNVGTLTVGTPFTSRIINVSITAGMQPFISGDNWVLSNDFLDFIAMVPGSRYYNTGAPQGSLASLVPLRISQFDRTPTSVVGNTYELAASAQMQIHFGYLQTGFSINTLSGATTTDIVTSATTSIHIRMMTPGSLPVGARFFVESVTEASIAEVTSWTDVTPPATVYPLPVTPPPYFYDVTIKWIAQPATSYGSPSIATRPTYTGFTNLERTNKVAGVAKLQNVMNQFLILVVNWGQVLSNDLSAEIWALSSNQDDGKDTAALTSLNTFLLATQNYLGLTPPTTTLITDAAIIGYNADTATRGTVALGRVVAINARITAEAWCDKRYTMSDVRYNLGSGTASVTLKLNQSQSSAANGAAAATALSAKLGSVLNSF